MSTGEPLKESALNRQRLAQIGDDIQTVYAPFDGQRFIEDGVKAFAHLELKARISWVSQAFGQSLPSDFPQALQILLESVRLRGDAALPDNDFGNHQYAPYLDFVSRYGCTRKDLELSLGALRTLTRYFSAEDAIRYFINAFPSETFAQIGKWSVDDDYHVRRLASEGTRPTLPWSVNIRTSREAAIPILDSLFSDVSPFVTRSVANHINDIAKIDPELAIATLDRWRSSGRQDPRIMDSMIRQGLRTLLKRGHHATFSLLGYSTTPKVTIEELAVRASRIRIGEVLEFTVRMSTESEEPLLIDYAVGFVNKSGNAGNEKVFRLKSMLAKRGQLLVITKRMSMKQRPTRALYPGKHTLTIQVNGERLAHIDFDLMESV